MKVGKHSCVSVRWNELYVFVPGLVSIHVELRHKRRSPPGPFFVTRFEIESPIRFLKNLKKDRGVKVYPIEASVLEPQGDPICKGTSIRLR